MPADKTTASEEIWDTPVKPKTFSTKLDSKKLSTEELQVNILGFENSVVRHSNPAPASTLIPLGGQHTR